MIGLLAPMKIVKAAEDISNNQTDAKQETSNNEQPTGEYREISRLPQLVASQKAQKIVFLSLMSLVSCNICSKIKLQNNQNQEGQINRFDRDSPSVKTFSDNAKKLTLVVDNSEKLVAQATIKSENHSEEIKKAA